MWCSPSHASCARCSAGGESCLVQKLLAWRHPGFSAHVGDRVAAEDKKRLEDTAAYLVRNPLSLKKLVHLDGQQAVLYRSRMNPSLGRNFEALDPLEWLARISDHIPDPGQHRNQVDPLVCVRCGQRMSILAFVSDQNSINRILDHLGLRSPQQDRPPPAREILRVAEHGEGWGVPASWD